jgi:hypothetical protein
MTVLHVSKDKNSMKENEKDEEELKILACEDPVIKGNKTLSVEVRL